MLLLMALIFIMIVVFVLVINGLYYFGLIMSILSLIVFIILLLIAKDKKKAFKKYSPILLVTVISFGLFINFGSLINDIKNYNRKDHQVTITDKEDVIDNLYNYKYVNGNQSIDINKDTGIMNINTGDSMITLEKTNCYEIGKNKYTCKAYLQDSRGLSFIFSFKKDDLVFEEMDSVLTITTLKNNTKFKRVNK